MFHNEWSTALKNAKKEQKLKLKSLLREPFDENKLQSLLSQTVSFNYEALVTEPKYDYVSGAEDGYDNQTKWVQVGETQEWKDQSWSGSVLNYNDVLTSIFKLDNELNLEIIGKESQLSKLEQKIIEIEAKASLGGDDQAMQLLGEETAKAMELKKELNSLKDNKKSLHQYLVYCINEILHSTSPDLNMSSLNMQKCIVYAIDRNDFDFAREIFTHPKLQSLNVLDEFEINGEKDNLFDYFLKHSSETSVMFKKIYDTIISMKKDAELNEVYVPDEMLITSTNQPATELGVLLLFEYAQEKLRELKSAFKAYEANEEYDIDEKLQDKISQAMLIIFKCEQFSKMKFAQPFNENYLDILTSFKNCFNFSEKTPTEALENCLLNQLNLVPTTISMKSLVNEQCDKLFHDRLKYQEDNKLLAEKRIKEQDEYNSQTVELYNYVTKRIEKLCDDAALRDKEKNKEYLVGIREASITDVNNKLRTFADSQEFSQYLKNEIMNNKNLSLSEKVREIIRTLEQAHNTIANRKRHRWFNHPTQTVPGIRGLLQEFAKDFNAITLEVDLEVDLHIDNNGNCKMSGLGSFSSFTKRLDYREKLPDFQKERLPDIGSEQLAKKKI